MKFENSKYYNTINSKKISFPFGNFYLSEYFIVSEINEGEHFDWNKVQEVIKCLFEHYDKNFQIGYISNRVNSYSSDPLQWVKVNAEHNFILASAIVIYNDFSFINATIEKNLSNKSIKRCDTLDQAINWILNIKEFKSPLHNFKTL